ncbi:hypothetical protein [Hymenobacter rubidus]|uniref:hypothetical protein n=1 Tax=Hymenobacter rubidus TaxID=1441626 RepID=UPI00191C9A78|nr:hypothetical protein [Hymenobacter rubidus]
MNFNFALFRVSESGFLLNKAAKMFDISADACIPRPNVFIHGAGLLTNVEMPFIELVRAFRILL